MNASSPAQPSLGRRTAAFAALAFCYFFYSYAWNTVDFLRPYWRDAYGLTLFQVAIFYTAQSLGALLSAVALAQVADRHGRRNTLAAISAGIGLSMAASVYMASFEALLAHRFVLGFFLGGVFACAVGTYVGLFDPRYRGRLKSIIAVTFGAANVFLP